MIFANPMFLFLIPMIMLLQWWQIRRPSKRPIVSSPISKLVISPLTRFLAFFPVFLRCVAFSALAIALARPQSGGKRLPRTTEGLDIMLAIDTSGSMRALDFTLDGDRRTRLDVTKRVVSEFVANQPDDRIGMIVFGSDVFTQSPLTLDHEVLNLFLDQMEIGMAGDATAIGDAIGSATLRMKDLKSRSKIVILLTDGENTSGSLDPIAAARAAAALGVKVYTIGIGSTGRVPIRNQLGWLEEVEVKLDEASLREIADITHGSYFRAKDTSALREVYANIKKLEKTKEESPIYSEREEDFSFFAVIAILALFIEAGWGLTRFRRVP